MKSFIMALAAAGAFLAAAEPARRGPCDVKVTEEGVYCPKEGRELFKLAVVDGKCANDGAEVKKIEICIKEHFV
jgi:hypothetical protein